MKTKYEFLKNLIKSRIVNVKYAQLFESILMNFIYTNEEREYFRSLYMETV